MELSFQIPAAVVVLLVAAAFAVSFLLYRYTVPPVPFLRRLLLMLLRGTALSLVLLIIAEPLLRLISQEERRPVIAVMADRSLSMTQKDAAQDRAAILSSLLTSDALAAFGSSAELRFLSFAHDVAPFLPDSLTLDGGSTDLSAAVRTPLRTIDGLQGIILLTDGNYNAGGNPLYDAEKSRVPLFTVGIGDTNEQKDIALSKLLANAVGYVDATLPVDASVKISGFPPRPLTVTLQEDGRMIEQRTIDAGSASGVTEAPVPFTYTPKTPGMKKLTVSVTGAEGELTEKNNSRSVLVKVLKNKMNIVVITGAPSPDVAAVMQTLDEDPNTETTLFYQQPGGAFLSRPAGRELAAGLAGADAAVLIGFPAAQTPESALDLLRTGVQARALPLLFIAGRTADLAKLRSLEPILPFTVASQRMDEQPVLPTIVPRYAAHQLLLNDRTPWEKLPPLYYSLPTFAAKTESQVLVSVKMQNVPLANPFFVIRTVGNSRSAAVLGYGLHRWKVLAGSADDTRDFFPRWFTSLVRWLAVREQDKFLRVESSKPFYAQGERIVLTGQAYDESYQPADDAEIRVTLRPLSGSDRFETALEPLGSGLYEGSFDGMTEGEYLYAAAALRSGDTLGAVTGRITVGEQSIEFAETRMNKPLLQQMAAASGGQYAEAREFSALLREVSERPEMQTRIRTAEREFDLRTLPWLMGAIVLLFGLEWLLRKRSGML